jgi:hypothetical protein
VAAGDRRAAESACARIAQPTRSWSAGWGVLALAAVREDLAGLSTARRMMDQLGFTLDALCAGVVLDDAEARAELAAVGVANPDAFARILVPVPR